MKEGLRKEIGGRRRVRGVTNSWRKRLSMRQVGCRRFRTCTCPRVPVELVVRKASGAMAFYSKCRFFFQDQLDTIHTIRQA
jgi:hypothetical protein